MSDQTLDTTTMSGETDDDTASTDYLVRLLFRIPAKSPEEAVQRYLEQIISHGLRNWSYRVENEQTGEMLHLDGFGEPVEYNAPVVEVAAEDDDESAGG